MKYLKLFENFNIPTINDWINFCDTFNINIEELTDRMYSVDLDLPCTLKELLEINCDALGCKLNSLTDEIPIIEILKLEPGQTYYSGGHGADIERIR
jgi:hypothetical protein